MALLENNLVSRKTGVHDSSDLHVSHGEATGSFSGTETLKVSGSTGSRVGVGPVPLWY